MTSRRRRAPPRQTGQDRSTQATAPQGGPSGPAPIKDRTSTTPVIDDDLHFKTGRWGRLARFFVRLRAAGDPYDETVVLPALIVIIAMRLNDLNWFDAWTVAAAVVVTGIMAGAWLGAFFGHRTAFRFQMRIFLRAISVGAIEAAGYALVYAGKFKFSSAVAVNLTLINVWMYWLAALVISTIHDHAVITETEWQALRARLALLRRFILNQSTDGALRSPQAMIQAKRRRWWQETRAQLRTVIRIIIRSEKFMRELLRGLSFWWGVLLVVLALVAPKFGISLSQLVQFVRPP